MALDEQTLISLLWGNTAADTTNWYLGAVNAGGNPLTTLATTEADVDRAQLPPMYWDTTYQSLMNEDAVSLGPFVTGTNLGGWFITYGSTSMNVAWSGPLGLFVPAGGSLVFLPSTLALSLYF